MPRLILLNGPPGIGKSTLAQLLARVAFIEALEHVAAEVGARFHEIVLLDTKENAVRRFLDRSQRRAAAGVPDAAGQMVQPQGGGEALEATYDRLRAVIGSRTHAVAITSEEGEIDQAYVALHQAIET